jgi:hypothetical protein
MVADLKVWRNVAIMLALFCLFMVCRLQFGNSLAHDVLAQYKSRIALMHNQGKDTVDVLFIGSSLTKYALGPSEQVVKQHLQAALKRPVRVERMLINSVNADVLLQYGIPAHIQKYHPDYIFLEGNMFLLTAEDEDKAKWASNFSLFYMTKFPLSVVYPSQSIISAIIGNLQNEFTEAYLSNKQDLQRMGTLKMKIYQPVSKNVVNEWQHAIEAISKNSSLVVMQYPVAAGPKTYEMQLENVLHNLTEKSPDAVWKVPHDVVTKQMFVDDAHMSSIGTERFLDWMALKLTMIHDKAD